MCLDLQLISGGVACAGHSAARRRRGGVAIGLAGLAAGTGTPLDHIPASTLCDHGLVRQGGSIQLARIFGVRIGVDPSWFIVLFLIIWSFSDTYKALFPTNQTQAFALAVASALLFFVSVVLHELGHAVVALRNGIGIAGIDLWLFGGLAKMSRDTNSPGVEFRVAVAGPLVTLAIVLLCAAAGMLLGGHHNFGQALFLNERPGIGPLEAMLGYIALVNAALFVFNLLPGFPLDGGRIARSIAWWRLGDRTRATRLAARLGRGCGYLLGGLGVFWVFENDLIGGAWFVFLGIFLARAAKVAEVQTQISSRLSGRRVADLMDPQVVAIPQSMPLDRVREEFILRYGWNWFAVVDADDRLLGVLERGQFDSLSEAELSYRTAADIAASDPEQSLTVKSDQPLEVLLSSQALQRLGAVFCVDKNGALEGVVTLHRLQRALGAGTQGSRA